MNSRTGIGMKTESTSFRWLECGHLIRVAQPDDVDCPFCRDYAEAYAADVEAELLDDLDGAA